MDSDKTPKQDGVPPFATAGGSAADGIYAATFLTISILTMVCDASGFWVGAFAGAGVWTGARWLTT